MGAGWPGGSISIQAAPSTAPSHIAAHWNVCVLSNGMRLLSGSGKGEFSDRMDVGRIISGSSLVPFALCTQCDPVPTPVSGTQGKEAVCCLEKDFVFLSRFGWPESYIIILTVAPWPPELAREAAPSQVRCMVHPTWYSASDSSKNKGYFEWAREPFLQPLCWHPQVV